MSRELFKALLLNAYYEKYKESITEDSFQDKNIKWLFQTLVQARIKGIQDISTQELKALHESYNPAITNATKRNLDIFFTELESITLSPQVGEELIIAQVKLNTFTEIAQMAMDAGDNKPVSLEKMQELFNKVRDAALPPEEEDEFVSTDLEVLLKELSKEFKWKIHLPPLAEVITGIGDSVFGIIAARPNCGKTGFCVSLIFQPGGFLSQGAKVHYVANEEAGVRTMVRGISCYTGMTQPEFEANMSTAKNIFTQVKNNILLKDIVGMDLVELESYIKRHKAKNNIDIIFIDQLDKIRVNGNFAGEHDRLRTLYTTTRELAKKYNIAIFGVSQASESAEGKLYYGFECLENSRTGKAAECDICICLGKESFGSNEGNDTGFRMANVVKNKLTGIERPVGFVLNRYLSRLAA